MLSRFKTSVCLYVGHALIVRPLIETSPKRVLRADLYWANTPYEFVLRCAEIGFSETAKRLRCATGAPSAQKRCCAEKKERTMSIQREKPGQSMRGQSKSNQEERGVSNELHKLFLDELADIYNAEQQLTKVLPKLAKAAKSSELRQAF